MSAAATERENSGADVRAMFTSRTSSYLRFIGAVLYPQGLRAFMRSSRVLRPGMRVLDAGCGTGVLTQAVLAAMKAIGLQPSAVDAFDLTPAMLERFRSMRETGLAGVRLSEADVLELDRLPPEWNDYDLIVSSAMLEYLPRQRLPDALAGLRARLRPDGVLLVFISRDNVLMRLLIGRWWKSNLYKRSELVEAFSAAGLTPVFRRFPATGAHLNLWGLVVEARPRAA